jgi:hypothetical protein
MCRKVIMGTVVAETTIELQLYVQIVTKHITSKRINDKLETKTLTLTLQL